jgi:hypothetical protein
MAAREAGYAASTIHVAYKKLDKPKIRAYIDEQLENQYNERVLSAKEVLERLSRIANGEAADGEKNPSVAEQTKALELLGKVHGLFSLARKAGQTETSGITVRFEGELEGYAQ